MGNRLAERKPSMRPASARFSTIVRRCQDIIRLVFQARANQDLLLNCGDRTLSSCSGNFLDMLLRVCESLQQAGWVTAIDNSIAASVIVELTHYFSFFLLVGAIVMVDLRILGLAGRRQIAAQMAEQLLPMMWTGLGLAILSGFILFAGDAVTFFSNPAFRAKMGIILLAVASGFIVQRNARKWEELPVVPLRAKCAALISLALWIGTILAAVEIPHLTYVP
jgi:hypothetical protein